MHYISNHLLLSILLLTSLSVYSKTKLKTLSTKQPITNIRFIDRNGKYTYYVRRSGDLMMSTNFDTHTILKSTEHTNYNLYYEESSSNIFIEKILNAHSSNNTRQLNVLYLSKLGDTKVAEVGKGVSPKLHLDDRWISYFDPLKKTITIQSLQTKSRLYEIHLANKVNPYFYPFVEILNEEEIIYTDINDDGFEAIVHYNTISKISTIVWKTSTISQKLEFCLLNNFLFLGQFSRLNEISQSALYKIPKSEILNISNPKPIYSSDLSDIGNISCSRTNNSIFFIQNIQVANKSNFEVAKLNLDDNKVEVISDIKYVTQFVNMDSRILIPFNGDFFVAFGNNIKANDNFFKNKEKEAK